MKGAVALVLMAAILSGCKPQRDSSLNSSEVSNRDGLGAPMEQEPVDAMTTINIDEFCIAPKDLISVYFPNDKWDNVKPTMAYKNNGAGGKMEKISNIGSNEKCRGTSINELGHGCVFSIPSLKTDDKNRYTCQYAIYDGKITQDLLVGLDRSPAFAKWPDDFYGAKNITITYEDFEDKKQKTLKGTFNESYKDGQVIRFIAEDGVAKYLAIGAIKQVVIKENIIAWPSKEGSGVSKSFVQTLKK